jgi:hypothetical protein
LEELPEIEKVTFGEPIVEELPGQVAMEETQG